ncbi:hypothetical protein SKAU_G00057950 [Synaphobranchus kaupii]|uniref:Uncharacterized protein n=1 Tax=Synaphobranchus kaupii TaxID=118154 RepID=A0A9Q1G5R5_SYNKA|nr:hypothetical protein SKAU_G00057950 [Synaphobranchus kaupii]
MLSSKALDKTTGTRSQQACSNRAITEECDIFLYCSGTSCHSSATPKASHPHCTLPSSSLYPASAYSYDQDEGLANRYNAAGVEKAKYQWVDRDCCAPFQVPDPQPFQYLQWVSWLTTDAIVAEATSANLINTCASRS